MTPKWPNSVEKALRASHCELEPPENGPLVHPFPERVDKRPFWHEKVQGKGGLRDHFLGVLARNVKL